MRHPDGRINPGHRKLRRVFRIAGPALAGVGALCMLAAFVNFAWAFGHFDRSPGLFWLFFVGAPTLFVGLVLTNAGYMGAAARYAAQEHAPVAADTLEYLAEETQPAVRAVASAVREGLAAEGRTCPSCAQANDGDASFCDACGAPLLRRCPGCDAENDADASFCDACGGRLS